MASNLSSIGFVFDDGDDFESEMQALADDAIGRLAAGPGDYVIWRSQTGAEIWFHAAGLRGDDGELAEGTIGGLTPFFEGRSRVPLHVTEAIRREDDTAFEGAFYAWVLAPVGAEDAEGEPAADDGSPGSYPLVFEAIAFGVEAGRPLPFDAVARMTLFAHEVSAFESEEAFLAASGGDAALAPQAVIPLGLFADALADNDNDAKGAVPAAANGTGEHEIPPAAEPTGMTLLTGRVAEHALLTNERSGHAFHWMLVETYDATIDVVADPEAVTGEIVAGGTVEVSGLMFARLLEEG